MQQEWKDKVMRKTANCFLQDEKDSRLCRREAERAEQGGGGPRVTGRSLTTWPTARPQACVSAAAELAMSVGASRAKAISHTTQQMQGLRSSLMSESQ